MSEKLIYILAFLLTTLVATGENSAPLVKLDSNKFIDLDRLNELRSKGYQEFDNTAIKIVDQYFSDYYSKDYTSKDFDWLIFLITRNHRENKVYNSRELLNTIEQCKDLTSFQETYLIYWKGYINYYEENYPEAIRFFKQAEAIPEIRDLNNNQVKIYLFIADSYRNLENLALAEHYYKLVFPFKTVYQNLYFNAIKELAYTYFQQGNLIEAINTINLTDDFNSFNLNLPRYAPLRIGLLNFRAFYYRELALNNPDSIALLTKSYQDVEESIFLANQFAQKIHFESDQLLFNKNKNKIFYKGIEASLRLNLAQAHDSLLQKAFYYSELDKNLSLVRYFNKKEARLNQTIPIELIVPLDSVSTAIENLEAKIYKEEQKFHSNNDSLISYYLLKQELLTSINQMEFDLEEEFPLYRLQRNKLPVLDTNFLFKLSQQKQIIEYQISDEYIYIFLVNNGKIHYHVSAYNEKFISKLKQYRSLIADANYIDFSDEQFFAFTALSHQLYQHLVGPLTEYMNQKPLLIIPDNELQLVPFESLLSKPYEQEEVDYSTLPYLLNSFDISYANSIFLLQHQMKNKQTAKEQKLLSYAPSYKNLPGNEGSQYLALRDARDELGNLPGAQKEVRLIKKQISSKAYFDQQASEEHFKQSAGNYPIIHCAMHTLIDNENPQFSKLVFTPDTDTKEDGLLHTYELNQMTIESEMVVLSACNTAFGHINEGEGLMNLSRGFTKAGSKSVLSTLWSVSDASSASVMDNFYRELVQYQSKSASLSRAKRSYLRENSGSLAHPFYWSGYILTGNDRAVELKSATNYTQLIIILLALSSLGFFMIVVKKRQAKLQLLAS